MTASRHIKDRPLVEKFMSRLDKDESGCWLWRGVLRASGHAHWRTRQYRDYAHRWSYRLFRGEIPAGAFVCHTCDVAHCVNPDHLYIGSHRDNMRDMKERGRAARPIGEAHPMARLNEEQVRHIRHAKAAGASAPDLACAFGVSASTINMAASGRNWKHIK